MKKIFILFAIFSLQIAPTFADENASNSATGTITVSGTIMIPTIDGQGTEPAISATVLIDGTTTGATADLDGNFTLPNVPANASLKIEYVGCTDEILPAKNNMGTITLDCGEQLDEVVVKDTLAGKPCATAILQGLNAESGTWKSDNNVLYCDIQCAKNWTKQSGTYEIDNQGGKSKQRYKCECVGDNIIVNGACTQINNCSTDKNATDAEYRTIDGKMICFITDCKNTHTPSKDGTKCNPVPRLSEEDSQKKIDELKDNAQKMRDKERSTENKLLGAAGIGATGIGAMQMLSASAEQSADQDAEAAMRAYLATFHCNYGMGKNIAGGEKQVELPGGNELIGLYAEYVNLANDLKIRKNALGMRAGIESEPILDSATSGLYDDIAIGKTSGAYTSLARAIMDPTGADAIAWAAQKSDSADKLKSGAITAGIGALGSLAGNLAINSGDAKKNKVNDIIAEFDKKKKIFQDLESDIKKIPPQVEKCPTGTTGTTPNCDCTGNNVYDSNRNICNPCNAPKIIENIDGVKVCKCPETHIESGDTCTPKPTGCELKGLVNFDICECIDNAATDNDNICKCINGFEENPTGTCTAKKAPEEKKEEKKEEAKTISIDMPADSLFLIGKAELSTDAKNALANFRKNMEDAKLTNCKITVTGHTDRTGKTALNQKLSEKRAQAVWDELKDSTAFNKTTSVVEGKGLAECTCGTGSIPPGKENDNDYKACKAKDATYTVANMRYAPCRRVTIKLDDPSCQSTTGGDLGNIIQTVASNITQ